MEMINSAVYNGVYKTNVQEQKEDKNENSRDGGRLQPGKRSLIIFRCDDYKRSDKKTDMRFTCWILIWELLTEKRSALKALKMVQTFPGKSEERYRSLTV